jgi:hypothetical protein
MCDDSYGMLDAVARERGRLKLKQNEERWQGGSGCGGLLRSSDSGGGGGHSPPQHSKKTG